MLKNMYFPRGMILCFTVMFYVRRSVELQRLFLMGHDFRNKKIINVFLNISGFFGQRLDVFLYIQETKKREVCC